MKETLRCCSFEQTIPDEKVPLKAAKFKFKSYITFLLVILFYSWRTQPANGIGTESRFERRERGTCLTDSAISGPIPSPGKRVARMSVESDEKALATNGALGLGFVAEERTCLERLPKARRRSWEAMTIESRRNRRENSKRLNRE